jgi:transcriptional regulator with XRE-family HTH domain
MTPEVVKQAFARNLRREILDRGWNQSELARRSGLSRDNISTYMRASSFPSGENMAKLAKTLDTDPATLSPKPTMTRATPPEAPDPERLYVADLLRDMLIKQRKGELYLIEEKLGMCAFLLEHPGWRAEFSMEANLMDEAA